MVENWLILTEMSDTWHFRAPEVYKNVHFLKHESVKCLRFEIYTLNSRLKSQTSSLFGAKKRQCLRFESVLRLSVKPVYVRIFTFIASRVRKIGLREPLEAASGSSRGRMV